MHLTFTPSCRALKILSFLSAISPLKCFVHTYTTIPPLNLKPFNSTISSYMRNGLVEHAHKLFDEMPQRNTVTWNSMIRGYFQNRQLENALRLFYQMPDPDLFSYNTVITGLMRCGYVSSAERVFESMGFRDVVTWNSMISGYLHNDLIQDAIRIFETMPEKDVASWTIMISGLVCAGHIFEAEELFEQMPMTDHAKVWNKVIAGYAEIGDVEKAKALFQRMPDKDSSSWNVLINGLLKDGRFGDAMRLFFEMPNRCQKLWNLIMLGMIRNGFTEVAHALIEKNPFSDVMTMTNMIVGYSGKGDVRAAVGVFELMVTRDTAVWNAMIFGLGENDSREEGLKLFVRMREFGQYPDESTFTSVLKICWDLPSLHIGKQIHCLVVKMGFDRFTAVSNAMVTMYARCGDMDSAMFKFMSMSTHDVISWNSMICGFAHQGDGERALKLFEKMLIEDVQPNHITFVGVLSACSHAGYVDQGKFYFDFMRYRCHIQPTSEHYTCIVDMLGRHGLVDEAMAFLGQIRRDGIKLPASVWGALLGACRMYKNIEIGKFAGEEILKMEPQNSGVYLILSEMYVNHGWTAYAERIRVQMKENGVKKQPGCSWIEVNNSGYIFLAGDCSHPEFGSISCILDSTHTEIDILIKEDITYRESDFLQ